MNSVRRYCSTVPVNENECHFSLPLATAFCERGNGCVGFEGRIHANKNYVVRPTAVVGGSWCLSDCKKCLKVARSCAGLHTKDILVSNLVSISSRVCFNTDKLRALLARQAENLQDVGRIGLRVRVRLFTKEPHQEKGTAEILSYRDCRVRMNCRTGN